MREILWISRWFHPAGVSLLVWLTVCAVLALSLLLACHLFRGSWRKVFAILAMFPAVCGALVCLGMIAVEAIVFEFRAPLCAAAYTALLATFAWIIAQNSDRRPRIVHAGAAFLLASAAFTYLFPLGVIPTIVELKPDALGNIAGANVLGGGPEALPVTEFADFQCVACAVQDETMEKLWTAYSDRIRYSFRHLPLKKHKYAEAAAIKSQCAAAQGRFWETKRLLFANQDRLEEMLSRAALPTIAAGDAQRYEECVESKAAWSDVQKDIEQAKRLGLRGTPSIIVGNKLITGMIGYPRLEVIVRRELDARKLLGTEEAKKNTEPLCGSCAE